MINLPPVRPRASYAGVDKDSLAYAVLLNPAAQADPIDAYQTRTKADESTASGTPLKYGARGGETITGNLGRDESGRFARIDEAVARSASLHGGKKPKKAARSAAQVAAAKRETAHAALQAAKIDKAVYDGVMALDDEPVKAGEESDAVKELVKAGYAEEAGGMIVPSALGSRLAKAAESGKPGKVAQVVARESQRTQQRAERTRARAQALDDKIAAYDDAVQNARNDRQRAIAQRRLDAAKTQRAALGDVGKSTLKHMPGKHNQSSHGHRGAVGGAFRSAYTAARAGGKTHSEAWNAGKHAAEGVREQMRVEKRAQAAANPKPKRTSATAEPTAIDKAKQDAAKGTYQLPHAHGQMIAPEITEYFRKTPNGTVEKYNELVSQANENMQYYTTHNQEMQRIRQAKTQAEQAQITPEQRARVQELNATPLEYQRLYRRDGSPLDQSREEKELLSAHTSLRMAKTPQEAEQALAKYTDAKARYDQHVDKTLAELPTVQARPFNSTTAAQLRAESGLTRTTQPEAPAPAVQSGTTREYPTPKLGETVSQHLDNLYRHQQEIRDKDILIPREEQLALARAGLPRKTNITPAEQAEYDKAGREIARIEQKIQRGEVKRTDQARKPTKAEIAEQQQKLAEGAQRNIESAPTEYHQQQISRLQQMLDSGTHPKTKKPLTREQRGLAELQIQTSRNELIRRGAPQSEASAPKTQTEGGKIVETLANNVRERRANEARLAQVQQEMQRYTTPDSPYASDHPEYERLRDERATLRARNSTLEAEYDKGLAKMREIDTTQSASLGSPEHQQLQQRVQEMQDRITTGRSNVGRKLSKAEIAESKDLLQKRQSKLDEFERRAGKQPEAAAPAPAPAPRSLFSNTTSRAPKPVVPGDTSTYPEDIQRRITGTTTRYNDQQARIAAAPRDRATKELAQKYLDEWRMSSDSGTYELAREAADPTLSSNRKRQRQLNELRKNQVELLEFHELLLRGQKFAPAQVQTMQRKLDRNAAIRKELAKEGGYSEPKSGNNPQPARPKQPAQPSAPRAAKPKVDTTPYVTSTPKTGNEETDKYLAARDRTHAILQSGVNPKTGKKLTRTERSNLRYRLDLIEQRTGITDPVLERARSMIGDFSTTSLGIGSTGKAVLSSAQRRKLSGSSFVFPDTRSFPITDKRDIQKAVHAWGRYQGKYSFEVFKRRLTAIARRMGAVDALPDTWQVKTKAADHDMTPPQDVRDAAKRGLALRRQFGRGGTEVGIARARDLSNGASIPLATINRMVSFFARHAVDKRPDWSNPSNPSNGYIAWLLWGGDAGRRWALAMQKRMTKE